MKTSRLKKFNLINLSLLSMLLLGATFLTRLRTAATAQEVWTLAKPPFVIRNYGGKCLDFGASPQVSGAPVFINDCNGTSAQQVYIEEINARHDVILRAGAKVIGVKSQLVNTRGVQMATPDTGQPETETPLELQDEWNRNTVYSQGQIFALDGDSIMLASNRKRVVKVQNSRGSNRTPLMLGQRDLADAEFWTFAATNGSNLRPTSGFVRVPQEHDHRTLAHQLASAVLNAGWGTVIELAPNISIDLTDAYPLQIPGGVTIRGDRRGVKPGPELWTAHMPPEFNAVIQINSQEASDVRITGLRMRGPTASSDGDGPKARAIGVLDNQVDHSVIIDHNELSSWPSAAVQVFLGDQTSYCQASEDTPPRAGNVRVARNFIHHNQRQNAGYGVAAATGGVAQVEGNTFVSNRHAITGEDGRARTAFRAWHNLLLSVAPKQESSIPDGGLFDCYTQDFDMHGTGDPILGDHRGGVAGHYVEIAWNTFLGTNRENFDLRGTPCYLAEFHHNISLRPLASFAINNDGDPSKLIISDNQFNAANPTDRLGVGDFDGDGRQDLFLATGAAWYYAPASKAEWRFINAQTDRINNLLFGDFDADGRTDVFTQHCANWNVSWGGASRWETINVSGPILGNAAIGDFDGDHRADVFYADGREWFVAFGGVGMFTSYALANHRVSNLRFGDFNGDGKTDVFGIVGSQWMAVYGGTHYWAPLRAKLTDIVATLIVADFNGDGRSDIATSDNLTWKVSYGGVDDWATLRSFFFPETTEEFTPLTLVAAIERFDGNAGADVLRWKGTYLEILAGGTEDAVRHSRNDMR